MPQQPGSVELSCPSFRGYRELRRPYLQRPRNTFNLPLVKYHRHRGNGRRGGEEAGPRAGRSAALTKLVPKTAQSGILQSNPAVFRGPSPPHTSQAVLRPRDNAAAPCALQGAFPSGLLSQENDTGQKVATLGAGSGDFDPVSRRGKAEARRSLAEREPPGGGGWGGPGAPAVLLPSMRGLRRRAMPLDRSYT